VNREARSFSDDVFKKGSFLLFFVSGIHAHFIMSSSVQLVGSKASASQKMAHMRHLCTESAPCDRCFYCVCDVSWGARTTDSSAGASRNIYVVCVVCGVYAHGPRCGCNPHDALHPPHGVGSAA
jgi:hypothetical protein